jgi:formylmethanofuran dehydrogenase subunit E
MSPPEDTFVNGDFDWEAEEMECESCGIITSSQHINAIDGEPICNDCVETYDEYKEHRVDG